MRISITFLLVALIFLSLASYSDAQKKPSKGKGKGKPSKPQKEPVVETQCKLEPAPIKDLYMGDAMQMVAAVGEKAKGMGVPVTICIKDRHNILVAHVRMKNAILGSVELACQKATTSALF